MLTDNNVLALIEEKEHNHVKIDCYNCGLSPELQGGLCGDCILTRHITID